MQMFEYAVWKDEKRDKDDNVVDEAKVLVEITAVLARSDKEVAMRAARDIPEEEMAHIDRIQVLVRSFP
jgi:hypothetical protein